MRLVTAFSVVLAALTLSADVRAQAPGEVVATTHLRLHSDPWMNLHHFLYQWSRAELGIGTGRYAVAVPEREDIEQLTPGQRSAWADAVEVYRGHLAELGHFSDEMLEIKGALLARGPDDPLPDVVPGLAEALAAAMVVYRDVWWPRHDRDNRSWIEGIAPRLRDHESFGVATLERAYGGRWDAPLRVDVSVYGNWAGGYTSNGPAHTVVLSRDEKNNQGLYGLEIILHEAGHQSALGRPLRLDLRAAFQAASAELPANLAHAALFFTAGWATARVSRELGLGEHVPYFLTEELSTFQGWRGLWPALEEAWLPMLEGRTTRQEALNALASYFAPAQGGR